MYKNEDLLVVAVNDYDVVRINIYADNYEKILRLYIETYVKDFSEPFYYEIAEYSIATSMNYRIYSSDGLLLFGTDSGFEFTVHFQKVLEKYIRNKKTCEKLTASFLGYVERFDTL